MKANLKLPQTDRRIGQVQRKMVEYKSKENKRGSERYEECQYTAERTCNRVSY